MVWDGCIKWREVFGNSSTILKHLECLETMCSKEWHEQSEMGAFNCFDPFRLPALLHEKENTGQLSIKKNPYESLTCMISKTFAQSQPLLAHLASEPINLTQYRHKWNSFKLCMLRQRRTDPKGRRDDTSASRSSNTSKGEASFGFSHDSMLLGMFWEANCQD